ncbi:MAG: CRISPR-associated protein Cas5 [Ruminococcus sp.]|nr:CRISPR-associated protein Cas5 [Ruminococcus sp.]MDD5890002.1 CRISPR-associated protein Cas5 [Ruminococcus sp.]MDD6532266.1 CRISPR-associated protein Cas5 [Ruminococcus sp.]
MKAIRLHLKQNSANYRREETVNCRMTYPLPPYSTVIGAIHKACGYTDYHPMQVSIQGKYGSQKTRLFKDNCFLNSLQNDRNTLVKLRNPEMLSTAYDIVAVAQKAQGNDFEKGITINVVNKDLIEEYRFLKRTKRRIDKHKKIVKSLKDKAKKMKADKNISAEEVKAFDKRVKEIDKTYKKYEEVKYTIPYSKFRTLATGPKYYEMLYDVELVIHIVSDENTMQDILDNIYNLTAIGRGEDFVEVLECTETELEGGDIQYDAPNSPFDLYMPIELLDKNIDNIGHNDKTVGMYINGTKYLLPKDYTVENLKGNMRKRNFNRIPVLFNKIEFIDGECDGIYLDKCDGKEYAVFLA